MHPHNGGSELTNFWLRWWETAGEAQPAYGLSVFWWGEATDLKKMMPRYALVTVATKPMILLVWKLWRMLVVALKKVVCRPWARFQAFGAVYPMVHRFFFWHVCVEMSYAPMPRDSNGNGWCQVKIVDEMFLFAWSWWSSDQHARINSNGRVSASLDTTWLKTTEWWLLAYGHPAVAQTVIALQRIADTAWRISSLIPSSLWLIFIYIYLNVHYCRSNIQAQTGHEWSTFLHRIDTNCWTGSAQRRNGWAMLSHFKPMLAYVPSNWQGNGISTLRTENIFTLWDVFSLYFPLRSFCCIVGHCSILEKVRKPFDRMIYCICVYMYFKKTCIHILYIYIHTLVILKEARNHLKESTNRSPLVRPRIVVRWWWKEKGGLSSWPGFPETGYWRLDPACNCLLSRADHVSNSELHQHFGSCEHETNNRMNVFLVVISFLGVCIFCFGFAFASVFVFAYAFAASAAFYSWSCFSFFVAVVAVVAVLGCSW